MNPIVLDALSWIGLALCIGAFFIKNVVMLRLVTLIGCSLMAVYYIYISVPQGMVSNIIIVLINLVYLIRSTDKENENYIDCDSLEQCES